MERTKLERAARLAGLELAAETDLEVAGADPVLPSPLHLGEGAATAIALVGQEADRLWQLRGGRQQALSIDVRHAAASLHSFALLKLTDGATTPLRRVPPVTAIWECGDGRHIFLHGSFTGATAILDELGLEPGAEAEAIARATMKRDAFELEDALAARGLCAAVCRSAGEWAAHPQGTALATKPVIELTRIGDAPPTPLPEGARPLDGVRVLDLTRVLAGPTCARTLAEHGADVLHIASPRLPTLPLFEMDTGHGKRQAWLDLDDPLDAETLRDLARGADVFSQGFEPRSLERRGFGVRDLARLRPGIVYVSENTYGRDGPWRGRPGWEQLAQAATGITMLHGEGRPALAPAAMNDYTTGYFGALGALMALRRRATEGGSWHVTVSLAQTGMWFLRLGHDLDSRPAAGGGGLDAAWFEERETGYGTMRFLRPALGMSETPPGWALPTSPPGSGEAVWG